MMSRAAGSLTALEIIFAQNMQQIRNAEVSNLVCLPLLVNQQREINACLLLENAGGAAVPETDRSQGRTSRLEFLLTCAQLRNMLTAEYSPIVP